MASSQNLAGLAALAALGMGVYKQSQANQASQAGQAPQASPPTGRPLSDAMYSDYDDPTGATGLGQAGNTTMVRPGRAMLTTPTQYQAPQTAQARPQVSPDQMQQYAPGNPAIVGGSNMGQLQQDQRGNFPGQGISYLAGGQGRQGGPDPTSYSPPQDRANFPGQGISYLAGGQGRQGGADRTVPAASPIMPQGYSRTGGPSFEDLRNYQAEKEQERMLAESRKKAPSKEEQLERSKKAVEKSKELVDKLKAAQGKKTGGSVKKMAKGGVSKVNKSSKMSKPMTKSSSRGDGIAMKGKTKGRFI